jgi:hypothetical protein
MISSVDSMDWSDHRFVILTVMIERIDECYPPYTETHGKDKGVMFFADMETATKYKKVKKVEGELVLIPDALVVVQASLALWDCNVAYLMTLGKHNFMRQVTEFGEATTTTTDGQHRQNR